MTKDEAIDELCGGICRVTKALSNKQVYLTPLQVNQLLEKIWQELQRIKANE